MPSNRLLHATRLLFSSWILALVACAGPQIGGPSAPRGDPAAGILTLPSGRSIAVYPAELRYSGSARYRWPGGRTYDGSWLDGRPEGIGTETRTDGERYTGTWRDGLRHGHGELMLADGGQYVGDFVDGQREGEGALRDDAGLYRGQWRADLPDGRGAYHGNDGSIYRGSWEAGERSGYGGYTSADGSRYEGDWRADRPHGFGEMHDQAGLEYAGGWRAGQRDGYGRARFPGGLIYEGTWVNGKRQGFGRETRPDGSSYQGEWAAGKRHGQGREDKPDGTYHEGSWEQNQALGPGVRRARSGIEISGLWNADRVSTGLLRLPTGPEYAGPLFRGPDKAAAGLQSWARETAGRGDPYAQLLLGTLYLDFASPPRDLTEARRWLEQAAAAGVAEARYRLAMTWAEDNPARAVALLADAAEQGHPQANTALGEYYQHGRGVPRDHGTATRYYRQGMAAGSLVSRNNLAWLLATSDDRSLRDPARAMEVIRPIALYTGSWQYLNTLAAACAAAGQSETAMRLQREALDAAAADPNVGEERILGDMRQRLVLYGAGKPYIEP